MQRFVKKNMIFIVLSSLETVHDTVQYSYCIFSFLNLLLRIRLKRQNPLLSYVREKKKTHSKCTMYYVEIKCQLDATDDIYCRFYCMLNMFRAILCPSSGAREYYTDGRCLCYLVLQRRKK